MRQSSLKFGLAFAGALLAASTVTADTIYLIQGDAIKDVSVKTATFKEIEYKDGSKKRTVKTDNVLRVEFFAKTQPVDLADAAALDGQFWDAIGALELYIEAHISEAKRPRYEWEPAYAMNRLIELNRVVGDAPGLIKAADQLIANAPDSLYVPMAFLAKAETQHLTGDSKGAKKTLGAFKDLIQSKSLSGKWNIEQKLASALYDDASKGKSLRTKLEAISKEAGSQYPVVHNRCEVAIGESWLEGKSPNFKEAEPIFQDIAANPKADSRTLAAAYTGLGDCIFKRAMAGPASLKDQLLQDAKLAYMRVVVVYKDETTYAPKAMFWAGRVFDESTDEQDKERAQLLYGRVMREYQGSTWATEAGSFRKR
jgi:hypothetical protein